ncbi:DUF6074 family protein [Fulvimarina sp. MAC3]|uniref:DUF6074 family protein n=1 Tax=Fulvimarina sp. MAC3 TaxID=3148887 RepID=UPI0031FC90FD
MKGEQMDLLSWERPTATIHVFPTDRMTGKVRQVALALDHRQGKKAEGYWRTECNRMAAWLQVAGVPEALIRDEVDRFALAVQRELRELHEPAAWNQPGGDAA